MLFISNTSRSTRVGGVEIENTLGWECLCVLCGYISRCWLIVVHPSCSQIDTIYKGLGENGLQISVQPVDIQVVSVSGRLRETHHASSMQPLDLHFVSVRSYKTIYHKSLSVQLIDITIMSVNEVHTKPESYLIPTYTSNVWHPSMLNQ